jgi:AcrR family transcriptional regulator
MSDTKERMLNAAEQLFAEQGYAATSLRSIVAAAGVNLAAIHYHYHSKEALLEAVIMRRATPANQERMRRLEECRKAAGRRTPALEALLEAFLAPTFRVAQDPAGAVRFMRLVARIHAEGYLLPAMANAHFGEMIMSYTEAFLAALPHLTLEEFRWRAHLAAGAVGQALRPPEWLQDVSTGYNPGAAEAMLQRLIGFLSAGFRTPMKNTKSRRAKCSVAS